MARTSRSKLALLLLGSLLLLGAAAFIRSPAPRPSAAPPENRPSPQVKPGPSESVGIHGRAGDPATRIHDGGWYIDDGAQHASLAENSVDISMLAINSPDDPELLEADLWAMGAGDDFKLMKAAYQCELEFLVGIEQVCNFRLHMVIHRNQDAGGTVKFVKPTSDAPMEDKCQAYSQCLANRVFLGETAPMPDTGDEFLAIHMDHRMLPSQGDAGTYKTEMASELEGVRSEYRQMLDNPDSEARELARMEALVKFMELRAGYPW